MWRLLFCYRLSGALALVALFSEATLQGASAQYAQTDLTSTFPGVANNTDPNLVEPTGMAFNGTSPIWIANQGAGVATLYSGSGQPQSLVVTVPNSSPTGAVFNSTNSTGPFQVTDGTHTAPGIFLFATTSGQIQGWNPGVNATQTEIGFTSPTPNAMYTGLALATPANQPTLYATDFSNSKVDAINGSFTSATITGNFSDPNLPAKYAPFNIANLNGNLFVSYALQNTTGTSAVPGAGNGLIDVFNSEGILLSRLVSNGGPLNEPWGMTIAPGTFGQFAGDLLVGNHGDGTIDAFNPSTGAFLGELRDAMGNPIVNTALWGLAFDPTAAGSGFDPNGLFFTATLDETIDFMGQSFDETGGLFGQISPTAGETPIPATLPLFATGIGGLGLLGWRRRRKAQAV
jgi:uncharacterized protein (TIGR03118 family)